MPIYEYRCSSCGADHEVLQKLSDPLLVTCPSCHKDALVKQLSAAGFQLKGSGWYVTDFRNGSKPGAKTDAKNDEKSGEKTGEKAGETADAKPAAADGAKTESAAKPPEAAAESKSKASTPAPAATKPTGTA